jgi:hypothetical protein
VPANDFTQSENIALTSHVWLLLSPWLRRRKPPSQTWRTFLENHLKSLVSSDYFMVPAASFRGGGHISNFQNLLEPALPY